METLFKFNFIRTMILLLLSVNIILGFQNFNRQIENQSSKKNKAQFVKIISYAVVWKW